MAHDIRQARLGLRDAVLSLYLGDIEVGPEFEGDRDREIAVGGRDGVGVDSVLDTVDLLLERRETVSAMVLGEAPGYVPLTTTVGGTISGYSLIGSDGIATVPPRR